MHDSSTCLRKDSSLNELLHEPIIAMLMSSDGVHSDDIRALFREVAAKDGGRALPRQRAAFESCPAR